MIRPTFIEKQNRLSVTAGMNQRYHQRVAHKHWLCDTLAKASTAVFAILGVVMSVASGQSQCLTGISIVVSGLAAVFAVILNIVPFGSWEQRHTDLLRRWTDLREEVGSIDFELPDADDVPSELVAKLKSLDAKMHRIDGMEPAPNKKWIDKAFDDEEKSRHDEVPE